MFIFDNFFILMVMIVMITIFIFYIGDQLTIYSNHLSVITGLSGGFIGFVLIAMITSIPEMVSTFVSTSKGSYGLAAGGILGSNAVNIAILSSILLFFRAVKFRLKNSSIFTFMSSLILLSFVGIVISAVALSHIVIQKFVVLSLFLFLYFFIMKHAYDLNSGHKQEQDNEEKDLHISPLKVFVIFTLLSVAIIVCSWLLVTVCKQMSVVPVPFYGRPLGEHFIGTLILALSTSIPELATTFQMVRRGSTEMAIENISGSNIFNLLVLVIAPFFTKSEFWAQIPLDSFYTIFIVFITSLLLCITGLIKESKKNIYGIYILIILLWFYSLTLVF